METLTETSTVKSKAHEFDAHDIYLSHRTNIDSETNGKDGGAKILHINSTIQVFDIEADDEDEYPRIGKIEAYKVSDLNGNHYNDILYACDNMSQELYDAFMSCFKKVDGEIQERGKKVDYLSRLPDSFIYIDTMTIDSNMRKSGIGTLAVERFIEDLAAGTMLIVKPFAIEDRESKETHKRVKNFWSSLGFTQVGKSGFYTMDAWEFLNER